MSSTIEVPGKLTGTFHDGTNMIVVTKGKPVTVARSSIAYLVTKGAIEDPEIGEAATLLDLSLADLIDVAIAEGVIEDADSFRLLLAGAIQAKRAGSEFDPGTVLGELIDPVDLAAEERPHLPQLDHDGDGHPGGSDGADVLTAEELGIVQTHIGGGYYTIAHPGAAEPEKVKGREAADARFEELLAEARAAAEQPGDDDGDGEEGDGDDAEDAPPA
jgi:hypothetical protein